MLHFLMLFQSNTSYGAGQHGPAANLSQLNSAVNTGPVEPVKISSQSYHLDGELYELLGINYGMELHESRVVWVKFSSKCQ